MILGREAEQAKVETCLELVRSGEGQLLVFVGEAGIGKTTLLEWTAAAASGFRILQTTGRESEADLPFAALADLLRPLADRIESLPAPQAAALGSALALVPAIAGDRLAVDSAAMNLVAAVAQELPLLLLIDDYHWIDSASREVIDFVARRTNPFNYGMLITSRGQAPPDHEGVELRLHPLALDAAEAVVARRGASPLVVDKVVALAAGNPLALMELPLDIDQYDFDRSILPISDPIERAFKSRFEGLAQDSQLALLCTAIEGSGSWVAVLRGLAALGVKRSAIEPAVAGDLLLFEGATIRFRHPLVRSVVIANAPAEDVRKVHAMMASVADDEDQRAWHLAAAAVGPDEEAASALEENGRRALQRGAAATATEAFRRAAAMSETGEAGARRLASAVRAAHRAGNMTLTAQLIESARAGKATLDSALLLLDADIRMRRGDFTGAHGVLRQEAADLADTDPHRAVTMLLLAAKLRVYRFEAGEGLREVEEALALLPTPERDLVQLASLAMTKTMAGHPQARAAVLAAADAALGSVHGHMHTLGIGWPLVWLEETERAEAFISRSVSIQREGGHLAYLPQALLALAELHFRVGRWESARNQAEEAIRLFEEGQQPTEAAIARAFLGKLEAVSGNDEMAEQLTATAKKSDSRSGLRAATAYADAALGLLALGRGRHAEAVEHLARARAPLLDGDIGEPWLIPVEPDLAEALIRLGSKEAGEAIANGLVQQGEAMGRRSAVAAGFRCLGLAASSDSFGPIFEKALALHEELPTPFELARTELCFGERLRRERQRVDARIHLRRALKIFENLGAEPWMTRAQAELSASGERLQRRNPVARLTPQERQVAALVGGGATNREAAATLFVSLKTIEFHLGNVYRKLGVRSRTELAQRARSVRWLIALDLLTQFASSEGVGDGEGNGG